MKILYHLFLLFLFVAVCSFADSAIEKKKISNQFYSFSIPSDWECGHPGKPEDCSIPLERKDSLYQSYYLQWRSPEDSFLGVDIVTYQRLDGEITTIEEIEANIDARYKFSESVDNVKIFGKTDIINSTNKKRFIIKRESISINIRTGKKIEIVNVIYLLCKSKNMIHCMSLNIREEEYTSSEIQLVVNDILDSFIVKQ